MQNGLAQLGRALLVHAAMIGLAFGAHDMSAANWALVRHVKRLMSARVVFVVNHARDFRNDVAAALNFNPVTDLHAQAFNLVHVVQSGATHRGATDGNRLEFRYWRELAGASDLYVDVFDLR